MGSHRKRHSNRGCGCDCCCCCNTHSCCDRCSPSCCTGFSNCNSNFGCGFGNNQWLLWLILLGCSGFGGFGGFGNNCCRPGLFW
jgi:hypothetical protein